MVYYLLFETMIGLLGVDTFVFYTEIMSENRLSIAMCNTDTGFSEDQIKTCMDP